MQPFSLNLGRKEKFERKKVTAGCLSKAQAQLVGNSKTLHVAAVVLEL